MIEDASERRRIAIVLGAIVDELAAKHVKRVTQEPALTARIGQALETILAELNGQLTLANHDIEIITQDVPDRGPGSMEKASGIDLYVNITVRKPRPISKGILVQAKNGRARQGVDGQCRKMLKRSGSSYGWFYGPDGTLVLDAAEILANPDTLLRKLARRTPAEVFEEILKCAEGDPRIGIPVDVDQEAGLADIMKSLKTLHGLGFTLTPQ